MANPILVTGAAGRVGAVGRKITELLRSSSERMRRHSPRRQKSPECLRMPHAGE
jgi:hypothetical protein